MYTPAHKQCDTSKAPGQVVHPIPEQYLHQYIERKTESRGELGGYAPKEALCMCKDRALSACPGEWEPGCDLGNNPDHVSIVEVVTTTKLTFEEWWSKGCYSKMGYNDVWAEIVWIAAQQNV
jgi:hypothetical protein